MFDILVTINDHSMIFSLFYGDLVKVKQGHSQMGSISSLIYNSMTKNLWKFHASTLLCTIIEQICPSNELWWPPKVKKGHSQNGSISGLNHLGMNKAPWKFHDSAPICTIVTLLSIPLHISSVIWPMMTLWRSKGAIIIQFKHKVWFASILS